MPCSCLQSFAHSRVGQAARNGCFMSEAVIRGTDWVQECLLEEGVLGEKGLEPWACQIFHKCRTQLNVSFKDNKVPSFSVLLRVKPRTSHTRHCSSAELYPTPGPKYLLLLLLF